MFGSFIFNYNLLDRLPIILFGLKGKHSFAELLCFLVVFATTPLSNVQHCWTILLNYEGLNSPFWTAS